ncbi:MAG: response regulator transcription factor [Anaerolineaceae bacterium]|nr:response regulator transcription factor [Anaerolineaceae bacterium]
MKVLVIDDDPAMTDLLKILLEAASSSVCTANSGVDGIAVAKSTDIDTIILDLMMPEMDGWQVCKAVRDFSSVPILILSALDSPGMVAAALDAGADDYLIKPVTSSVLIAHLMKLVRRNHRPDQNLLIAMSNGGNSIAANL